MGSHLSVSLPELTYSHFILVKGEGETWLEVTQKAAKPEARCFCICRKEVGVGLGWWWLELSPKEPKWGPVSMPHLS